MSTSPSWFDQEKFSRLVKKKTVPKPPPVAGGTPAPSSIARVPANAPVPPRRGSGSLPVIPSRASTGPLPAPPRSGALPPVASRPPTTSLAPPLTRTGGVSAPMPSTRPATGPLPAPPTRSTGALPPPPLKKTGPVPASLTRSTGHLPPPPQRDASGRLPLPRAQTGRLPVPAGDAPAALRPSTEDEPMAHEAPSPAPTAETPAFTPPSTSPPTFIPPPSHSTATEAAAEHTSSRPVIPVPDFKPLFGYDSPEETSESGLFHPSQAVSGESQALTGSLSLEELREQVELLTQERDQALAELEITRRRGPAASDDKLSTDLTTAIRERDEARMEVIVLRNRIETVEQTQRDTDAMASQLEELSHVIDERDSVRRDYASLREQYETLKLDRSQLDSYEETERVKEENKQLRDQIASRGPDTVAKTGSLGGSSTELAALREQAKQAKEEASLAHRGLALSQKALQETREALREATDGSSSTQGNLEEAKKERATLTRQNMLLQGQVDQLTRDLSATKAKLAAKGA